MEQRRTSTDRSRGGRTDGRRDGGREGERGREPAFRQHLPPSSSPSSALIRRNRVNSHEVYVSPRRRISMQIHRYERFAVKFQGLPRRRRALRPFGPLCLSLSSSPSCRLPRARGGSSFPKLYELSVRSSQLLCWELTGQHPISNKACHRAWSCLTPTHLYLPEGGPSPPRRIPAPLSSLAESVFPNSRRNTSRPTY